MLELSKVFVCVGCIVMYAVKTAYVKYSLKDLADREGEKCCHRLRTVERVPSLDFFLQIMNH